MRTRLITGPILIVALIALIWADALLQGAGAPPGSLLIPIVLVLAIMSGVELTRLFQSAGIQLSKSVTCAAIVLGIATSSLAGTTTHFAALDEVSGIAVACTSGAMVLLLSMIVYSRHGSAEGVIHAASATVFAFVYLGLMAGFILVLRLEYDGWVVLALLLITKFSDIGAFFTGTAIGRHKLIAWLSPGKTWEGLIGGVALSSIMGVLATMLPHAESVGVLITWWQGLLLGGLCGILGQGGDLMASMLKRDAGVKDSSTVVPGMGGLLDVVDSPLLVMPVAYWVLEALTNAASSG